MSRSRAVRSGFSALFARPAIYFGEATWRSIFSLTAWALAFFAGIEFLKSLPVSNFDALGLSGIFPPLFPMAVRHIFTGTGPLFFQGVAMLVIVVAILWWVASSVGRLVVLPTILRTEPRIGTVIGLQFTRAVCAAVLGIAYLGFIIWTLRVSGGTPRRGYFFGLVFAALASLAWSSISWYLTLAPLLACRNDCGIWESFESAAILARDAATQFTWIAFVFWCLRLLVFGIVLSMFFSLAAIAAQFAPAAMIVAVVFAVVLYGLLSYLLHAARLASYARVIEWSQGVPKNSR